MRYILRNKPKIKDSFGKDFLDWLDLSIGVYFKDHPDYIPEHIYEGERFKIIHVDNVQPHTDSFFELYVISITYDVYLLAYKSCCG